MTELSPVRSRHTAWDRLRRDRSLILMTLPTLLLLATFAYFPLLGNVIAWKDYTPWTGVVDSPWVGWANFTDVVTSDGFLLAVRNTLVINAFQLVFFFPVPILLALLLNSLVSARLRAVIQSVIYLPHFFSWVIVISIFQQMVGGSGLLSKALQAAGLGGVDLMTNPDTFLVLLTTQSVWKDAGWGIVIFLAALSTVDQEQYEAAAIDGANRWRRTWHITLPALRPVIVLLLILRLGDALNVGFEQLILQRNAVGVGASEVLDTFVYYQGVIAGVWGFATAAGLMKGVVSLLLVLAANKLAHVFGESGVYQRS
ncbi:ABC transporter permease subunit [Actinomycetes bacterium KLBMP 9759]